MLYLNKVTGEFAISFRDASRRSTQISVPDGSTEFGDFIAYERSAAPLFSPITHIAVEVEPLGGVQQWAVIAHSEEAVIANRVQAVESAIQHNNAAYEAAIASLTRGYPPSEIATWERQRDEAMAWASDSGAKTPWIDMAASARGIPRDEYLSRTRDKANLFANTSAHLTGLRQRYENEIKTAANDASLAALTFVYSPPAALP